MSTSIGEFFIDLVVDAGKGELTVGNLVKSMGELEVASVGEIAVLAELANRLAQITDAAIRSALGFHEYEASVGGTSKALQEWQSAARHTTVSADTVRTSMMGISEQLEDIQRFGEASHAPIRNLVNTLRDVSFAGLTPKNPEELLKRIRQSHIFQGMNAADQFGVLRHAGLGGMLELMQMRQKDFDKYSKETTVMSEREIEKYNKIHDTMASIEAIAANIKRFIADWASDATIAFFEKVAKTLQLELDSLKEIRAYFDAKNAGETNQERALELAPEAVSETKSALWETLKAIVVGHKVAPITADPVFLRNEGFAAPTHKTTNIKLAPVLNIHGSKLNKHELALAMQEALDRTIIGLPAQLNLGPV